MSSFRFFCDSCSLRELVEAWNIPKNTMGDFVDEKRAKWSMLRFTRSSMKNGNNYSDMGKTATHPRRLKKHTYHFSCSNATSRETLFAKSEQTLLSKEKRTWQLNWWRSVSSCRPVWYRQKKNVSKWPKITRFSKNMPETLRPTGFVGFKSFLWTPVEYRSCHDRVWGIPYLLPATQQPLPHYLKSKRNWLVTH